MSWPQDTGFRTVGTKSKLTYLTLNPVVAVKLPLDFSIGGGLMVNYANMDLEGLFVRTKIKIILSLTSFALTATVGAWVTIWVCAGSRLTNFNRRDLPQFGDGLFEWPHEIRTSPSTPLTRRSAQMDFEFPLTVVCGLSYRPTPKWNLEFDAITRIGAA